MPVAVGARTAAVGRAVASGFGGFGMSDLLPGGAARASLAVALALGVAVEAGSPASGVAAAAGAFSVGIASFQGAYLTRLQAALAASLAMAVSTLVGALIETVPPLAVLVTAAWAFAAGLATALGTAATVVAIQACVALLIAGQFAMTPTQAALRALLVLAGGLVQVVLVLAGWPLRTYAAERDALATAYAALAVAAHDGAGDGRGSGLPPPQPLDDAASVLADPHPLAGDEVRMAFRTLLDQAVRIRGELSALAHARERAVSRRREDTVAVIDGVLAEAAESLEGIAHAVALHPHVPARLVRRVPAAAFRAPPAPRLPGPDLDEQLARLPPSARQAVRAMQGELRAAARTASRMRADRSRPGAEDSGHWGTEVGEARLLPPLAEPLATLRATLDLRSETFRHAVRLAGLVGVTDILSRLLPLQHGYWVPLTALVVLRPDFASTIGRGASRVVGTAAGAVLATVIAAEVRPTPEVLVALVAAAAFGAYAVFKASMPLFAVLLTCYVVFLLAVVGLPGHGAAGARLAATALGGGLALAAYAAWPTWERVRLPDRLATLVQAQADYAAAVLDAYASSDARRDTRPLLAAQSTARRTRATAETSLARASDERDLEPHPASRGDGREDLVVAGGVVAAMRRSALASLTLHTRLPAPDGEVLPAAAELAADLRATARALAAELRHDPVPLLDPGAAPPDLRASYARLLGTLDESSVGRRLLRLECDEITNAYNTVAHLVREARRR